jgi:transposase
VGLIFLAARRLPPCVVAMEAFGGAHHWAREIGRLGHMVRLIPPAYVKPFVKRQKSDASDAEAICEAAQRLTMRFVTVKSEAAQASGAIFRTRDLPVRQRTQHINAIRGQLTEYGPVASKGLAHLPRLLALVEEAGSDHPTDARAMLTCSLTWSRSSASGLRDSTKRSRAVLGQRMFHLGS